MERPLFKKIIFDYLTQSQMFIELCDDNVFNCACICVHYKTHTFIWSCTHFLYSSCSFPFVFIVYFILLVYGTAATAAGIYEASGTVIMKLTSIQLLRFVGYGPMRCAFSSITLSIALNWRFILFVCFIFLILFIFLMPLVLHSHIRKQSKKTHTKIKLC